MKPLLFFIVLFSTLSSVAQTKNEHYDKAAEYKEKKDYRNALREINLAMQTDSTKLVNLLLKGNILFEAADYNGAYESYTKAIELYPDDVIGLNQRGLMLRAIQQFEYSIQDFDKALEHSGIDSLRISLLVNRGAAKLSMRNFKGAYDDFMIAYQFDSLNIVTLNNLATVCDEIGKGDQTLTYLYKILSIDSTFIGAYGNIGFKYQEMGDYKKAIQFFDKVLSLDPDDALAFSNRSYNRLKLGDLTGALSDIEKSIALYPTNSYAFRNRALIYIAQKKINNACADLDKALELGYTTMYGSEVEDLKLKNCTLKSL